jgi:hypothetical protein
VKNKSDKLKMFHQPVVIDRLLNAISSETKRLKTEHPTWRGLSAAVLEKLKTAVEILQPVFRTVLCNQDDIMGGFRNAGYDVQADHSVVVNADKMMSNFPAFRNAVFSPADKKSFLGKLSILENQVFTQQLDRISEKMMDDVKLRNTPKNVAIAENALNFQYDEKNIWEQRACILTRLSSNDLDQKRQDVLSRRTDDKNKKKHAKQLDKIAKRTIQREIKAEAKRLKQAATDENKLVKQAAADEKKKIKEAKKRKRDDHGHESSSNTGDVNMTSCDGCGQNYGADCKWLGCEECEDWFCSDFWREESVDDKMCYVCYRGSSHT